MRAPSKRSSISTVRCLLGKTWKRASVCTRAKRGSVMTLPRPRPPPRPPWRPLILLTKQMPRPPGKTAFLQGTEPVPNRLANVAACLGLPYQGQSHGFKAWQLPILFQNVGKGCRRPTPTAGIFDIRRTDPLCCTVLLRAAETPNIK